MVDRRDTHKQTRITDEERIRQLEQELAASQATIDALVARQVEAGGDGPTGSPLLRKTQEALLQSEGTLRAIFETALEAILIATSDGTYVDANPAASELLGKAREEIIGQRVGAFTVKPAELHHAWLRASMQGHDSGLYAIRRPDGSVRIAEYTAVADFIPGRNLSVMRDVTERLHAQMAREEAMTQLRERVKELTLLHQAGQLFDQRNLTVPDLLQALVKLIPPAWQYADHTVARIQYGDLQATSADFTPTPWVQRAAFRAEGGHSGTIEVYYTAAFPDAAEGPFLAEERTALDALTAMLQADLARRQASRALQRSEARYRELFETMAQGVIYQDRAGKVIDINPAARQILGVGEGDIATHEITNNDVILVREDGSPFPPDERPGRRAIRTGQPVFGEVMGLYLPEERNYRWIVVNAMPQFRAGEAEPYQVYSTLQDITERKRSEERRAQLAALVESSQDAIIGVDFDGTITSWNRGAQSMFGFAPAEAIGQHFNILSPPEHREEQAQVLQRVQRGETVDNYSTMRLTKDGRRIFVSFSISPIVDATGTVVGVAGIARDVTAQKRAETRLRFQAQLLNSVDESIMACDFEERVVYWGNGAAALYGYTRQEAMGRTLPELNLNATDSDGDARRMQLEAAYRQGSWSGEVQQQRKDGSMFWARISVFLVKDQREEAVGYIAIVRDVTAERQHERELQTIAAVADVLRTTETLEEICAAIFEQLATYLEVTGCALAILEPDNAHYRLAYVHGPYDEYRGRVIGLDVDVTGQVIREGRPFVSSDWSQAMKEAGYVEPVSLMPPNWSVACVPLIAGNRPLGALWAGRAKPFGDAEMRLILSIADMLASAIQRAHYFERLEEQAVQVQRIMDTVEDGLLLLDGERRVVLANPSALTHLAALGVQPAGDVDTAAGTEGVASSLVGQYVSRLGDRPLHALLQPGAAGVEQAVSTINTPRLEFSVAAHPVVEKGETSGWVLVLRDVTEARRTQEMVHQQERLAAVGQLAAGIAHDFNNVMSAIVLYAQILQRRDDLSDKERRRLDVIYRQANHAIDLIKQILDFSRRSVMERSALDVTPFFKEMFRLFDRTLPETINLSLQYQDSEYVVMADPTRLQQVITNLAINARDAMPDGGTFLVALSRFVLQEGQTPPAPAMTPGAWLKVAVSDDGEGMTAEMMQHAFEPFYTTKGPGKGTGLGLAQVYGIIRQHDGFITVDSMLGQGTTFTIYLPLLEDDSLHEEAPVPTFAQATGAAREATILVVEDEEWARVAVQETLEALGYRVLTAQDGQAALDLFARHGEEIDLVLSDMVMPEMGGLKLFEHIRANHPLVKMVIMSGYPLEDGGRSLMEQGIVAWISKPFSVNDLAEKVAEQLG